MQISVDSLVQLIGVMDKHLLDTANLQLTASIVSLESQMISIVIKLLYLHIRVYIVYVRVYNIVVLR